MQSLYAGCGGSSDDDVTDRVLAAVLASRTPGWNFPGHYLGIEYHAVHELDTRTFCQSRPEFLTEAGQLDFSVLAVLCDMALAACTRPRVGAATRLATLSLSIYLHGSMGQGSLNARSRLLSHDTSSGVVTATAEVQCGSLLQATAIGSFLAMQGTQALAPVPLGRRAAAPERRSLDDVRLSAEETELMRRAAQARHAGVAGFLRRFWGCSFTDTEEGSAASFDTGQHAGNRVGHVQGGLLAALAAAAGQAAAGDGFRLAAMHADYSRPGRSPQIHARARRIHRGSSTANAAVVIADDENNTLLSSLADFVSGS